MVVKMPENIDVAELLRELKNLLNLDGKQRVFEQNQELKSSFFLENADPEAVSELPRAEARGFL